MWKFKGDLFHHPPANGVLCVWAALSSIPNGQDICIIIDQINNRRAGLVQWWELSHWVTRSWVRSSLSIDFAGKRLIPSPDPTHVGASGTGSALPKRCFGRKGLIDTCMAVYHSLNCSHSLFSSFVPLWYFYALIGSCLKDEDGDWYETGLHIFCKLQFWSSRFSSWCLMFLIISIRKCCPDIHKMDLRFGVKPRGQLGH